jgi:hypothetical protein
MVSFEEARQIAIQQLQPEERVDPFGEELTHHEPCVLLDQHTIARPYGWVFFYQSERYLLGDEGGQLFGNSPMLITRIDGAVHLLGTAGPIGDLLRAWELREGTRYISDPASAKPRWF